MTTSIDRLTSALADRYSIERELGAGGMATVYLAHDVKHDRQVAVKVLRPELAESLGTERFLQEIKIAAKLNHPHILPLLDSGAVEEQPSARPPDRPSAFLYYVMPYVESESLRDKLDREGELPFADTVRILHDVVDALAKAHSESVVHRDIKPDNVMLSGRHALVTDFGVAKAVSEAKGGRQLTTVGMTLGTPTYMAPEQAAADPQIDSRADIYAVGVLAYEMLTGRPPFIGESHQEVLAAHVTKVPEPVTTHRDSIPPDLAQLVMKCLEKQPSDRWQSADEIVGQLEGIATPSGGVVPTEQVASVFGDGRGRVVVIGLIVVAIFAIVSSALNTFLSPPNVTFTTSNNRRVARAPEVEWEPRISPNGNELVYSASRGFDTRINLVDIDGRGRPHEVTTGIPGIHMHPIWSPDGNDILFTSITVNAADGTIDTNTVIAPKLGGTVRTLPYRGLVWDWTPAGNRLAYVRGDTILVGAIDGTDESAVTVVNDPHSLRWSPDGTRIAFVSRNSWWLDINRLANPALSSIWVVSVEDGPAIAVTDSLAQNQSPIWAPDGQHLLFVSDREGSSDLYSLAIGRTGRPRGEPRLVANLDAHTIAVSTDGSSLAYSKYDHRSNLWSLAIPSRGEASAADAEQLTFDNQRLTISDVSWDGEWLVYDTETSGNQDIYRQRLSGGEPEQITTHPADDWHPAWSPDGNEIAFYSFRSVNRDVFVISAIGGAPAQLTDHAAHDHHPSWSADGLVVAFHSDRTGQDQIWAVRRDEIGGPWSEPYQISREGGEQARWSPVGESLVFVDPETAIRIIREDGFEDVLLQLPAEGVSRVVTARWSADGNTVYFLSDAEYGRRSIWSIPASGGEPRRVVRFDNPALQPHYYFSVDRNNFYFVLREDESDIWTMDLEMR